MIELNYILDPAYRRETEEFELHTATDTDLEFYVFCGDFYFRIGTVNFDACWRWIPVFGLARQFYEASLAAANGQEPLAIWFSECSDEIRFALTPEGRLEVTSTYSPDRATCSPLEMLAASRAFLTRVCRELAEEYPRVVESPAFAKTQRNILGANRHFARWTMGEFLSHPTVENARQLESALIPLADGAGPEAAALRTLADHLAQFRPEGGPGFLTVDELIPAVSSALERLRESPS